MYQAQPAVNVAREMAMVDPMVKHATLIRPLRRQIKQNTTVPLDTFVTLEELARQGRLVKPSPPMVSVAVAAVCNVT